MLSIQLGAEEQQRRHTQSLANMGFVCRLFDIPSDTHSCNRSGRRNSCGKSGQRGSRKMSLASTTAGISNNHVNHSPLSFASAASCSMSSSSKTYMHSTLSTHHSSNTLVYSGRLGSASGSTVGDDSLLSSFSGANTPRNGSRSHRYE